VLCHAPEALEHQSGRMFHGVKKTGAKNPYVNRCDESGRMFPGVKKIGTKPLFYIVIYLAALLRRKCVSPIANSCTSQASEKEATQRVLSSGVSLGKAERIRTNVIGPSFFSSPRIHAGLVWHFLWIVHGPCRLELLGELCLKFILKLVGCGIFATLSAAAAFLRGLHFGGATWLGFRVIRHWF
jgi:hypothetical protein